MTDAELKQQLADITTELYHCGVVTGSGGNVSVRSMEHENAVWITPSAIFKGSLKPKDMILIDMEGKKLEGESSPSVESVYHAGVMKLRPEVNAVVHSHAPYSTVWAMTEDKIPPINTEAIFIGNLPTIPWYMGGSKDLANAVLETVGKTKVGGAFLKNHGLMTIGKDLRQAADGTLMVEHTLKILIMVKLLGIQPPELPEKAVKFLSQFAGSV